MCKVKLAAFTQEERENAAKNNSLALEALTAGKGFIKVGDDSTPRQASEEVVPLLGSNKVVA